MQQYHDTTMAAYGSNGNEAAYRPKETTYHSNETSYRPNGHEGTYRHNEKTTAYNHTNKTIYRPETATAATFANAGRPRVCFYRTPSSSIRIPVVSIRLVEVVTVGSCACVCSFVSFFLFFFPRSNGLGFFFSLYVAFT